LQLALKSGSADSQGSGESGALAPGMSDELLAEIVELLRTGAKIPAIKAYREAIPSSLKEAKDAVEEIERQYDIPKARSGCGATVLLCLASIWLILWFR